MTQEGVDEPAGDPATIVECTPPRRLVVDTAGPGETWRPELDLAEEDGRTVLVFRQRFAAGTDVADFAGGWHWYLDKLDAEVSDAGTADWRPSGPRSARATARPDGRARDGHRDGAGEAQDDDRRLDRVDHTDPEHLSVERSER